MKVTLIKGNHLKYKQYISDFFTSTELIPKRRLNKWIQRPGFGIRKVAILKWIVLGNVLTLGYKTTLLSSLITINYEDPIDNMFDLDKSGLPFIMAKGVSVVEYIRRAPGAVMARIFKRRILHSYEGSSIPSWVVEMYVKL